VASDTEGALILIIDGDSTGAASLAGFLRLSGYRVSLAHTGPAAKLQLREQAADLVILDLVLPDIDGLIFCSELAQSRVPIIACSGKSQPHEGILALRLGADDFITKPFDMEDLSARIAAVLRRCGATRSARSTPNPTEPQGGIDRASVTRVGKPAISRSEMLVGSGGQEVRFTPVEYRLVCALAERTNQPVARPELRALAWGFDDADQGRSLDVHVARIRKKLKRLSPTRRILAVRGYGYKMVSDVKTLSLRSGD